MAANRPLVLSVFPGIDLFGMAFERSGFCVVKGPDLITGGDIRTFFPPKGAFAGVIGGSPCQDFSILNSNPGGYGLEMLDEYCRVVNESSPDWFLFENVPQFPSFTIEGYVQQRFPLDLCWFTEFSRLRHFIFGSKSGVLLNPIVGTRKQVSGTAVTGSDKRSFSACCDIQGLPANFDLPFFTLKGKKQAVANGVPIALGRYLADLISEAFYGQLPSADSNASRSEKRCRCGCGRVVIGKAIYSGPACRKRMERRRKLQSVVQ